MVVLLTHKLQPRSKPCLSPYSQHKLQTKSKPCIFVSYSSSQSAYHLLDPLTNKIYTSRHVQFVESIFPYQSLTKTITQPSPNPDTWLHLDFIPLPPTSTQTPPVTPPFVPQTPSITQNPNTIHNSNSSISTNISSHSFEPNKTENISSSSNNSPQPQPPSPIKI